MVATSGDRLLSPDAVDALRTKLFPRASLITPNLPEAAALLGETIAGDESDIERQGRRLLAMGCPAVLIKGGHGQGPESVDYLFDKDAIIPALCAAHRYRQHARHWLLTVVGHCCGIGQGPRS